MPTFGAVTFQYIASLPPYANVSAMPRMVAGIYGLVVNLEVGFIEVQATLPMHKEGRVAVSDGVSAVAHGVVER